MHAYETRQSWEPLNNKTSCGMFIANDCNLTPFWIVRAGAGKIAIQLSDGRGRPAYSYIVLSEETVLLGRYRGTVSLDVEAGSNWAKGSISNLVGTIQHRGWWPCIRLAESNGRTWLCCLADSERSNFEPEPTTYRRWSLTVNEYRSNNQIKLVAEQKPRPYNESVSDRAGANVVNLR
jgi:hypothetical protein